MHDGPDFDRAKDLAKRLVGSTPPLHQLEDRVLEGKVIVPVLVEENDSRYHNALNTKLDSQKHQVLEALERRRHLPLPLGVPHKQRNQVDEEPRENDIVRQ